jgi:hypothetical protein
VSIGFFREYIDVGGFGISSLSLDLTAPGSLARDAGAQHAVLERQASMLHRSPFLTLNGRAGFGPRTTELDDTIWLFEGGRVPYILCKD